MKPVQSRMVILGDMGLRGAITPVSNLAETIQVAWDAGARRILIPMSSVDDIPTIPGELFAKFQTGFYTDPVDAVFKAPGVEWAAGQSKLLQARVNNRIASKWFRQQAV